MKKLLEKGDDFKIYFYESYAPIFIFIFKNYMLQYLFIYFLGIIYAPIFIYLFIKNHIYAPIIKKPPL